MTKLHFKDVVADYEDEMVHYIDVVVQSEDMVLIMRLEKYCILKNISRYCPLEVHDPMQSV